MSKKILVVDDEKDIRMYLTSLLMDNGYETCTAEDGFSAIGIAREERPDLITLDLMMPNKSGTDFYRQLARDADLKDTPVIIVSGLPGRDLAVTKPVAVFDKPIDPEKFLAAVRGAI